MPHVERSWLSLGGCAGLGWLLIGACTVVPAAPFVVVSNEGLSRAEAADQADRRPGPNGIDWSRITPRDQGRRRAVMQWLARGEIRTGQDYFNAAVIMQHGDSVKDARMALAFATLAAQLDPARVEARQMTAMSWDRLLEDQGQPQWYGTQFVRSASSGAWQLYPVQPGAISEQQRTALALPSLAEDRAHLEAINARSKSGAVGH